MTWVNNIRSDHNIAVTNQKTLESYSIENGACPLYYFSEYGALNLVEPLAVDDSIKSKLRVVYDQNHLAEITEITLKKLINRRLNLLYYYQNTKTKNKFVHDQKIQDYFGTKDIALLGEFFDIINKTKNPDELVKYPSLEDVILDPNANFLKESEIYHSQGESVQKLFQNVVEREIAPIEMAVSILNPTTLPASVFLHKFSNTGDPLTDILVPITTMQKKKIAEEILKKGLPLSDNVLDLIDQAFLNAFDTIKKHSLDVNNVGVGTDRLTIIIPPKFPENEDQLEIVTRFLIERILEKSFLNTIDEFKLSLTGFGSINTSANTIVTNANENTKILVGNMDEYPKLIRNDVDNRRFIEGIGLSRIDRLGRDWNKLKILAGNAPLFSDPDKMTPENAHRLATNDFRIGISRINFNTSKISDLNQTEIINKIIMGFVKKMENSIAQHQVIEFMRSGRWPQPKNLGIDFNKSLTIQDAIDNGLLTIKYYDELIDVHPGDQLTDLSSVIIIPLQDANGNTYDAAIDKSAFFAPQEIRTQKEYRFGITKYLDKSGNVLQFENLDLFSVKVEKSHIDALTKIPLGKTELRILRKLQKQVFNLIFSIPNQGHTSNFLFGRWMPENNILTFSGLNHQRIENILQPLKSDYPITFNHIRIFDLSPLNLLFKGQANVKESYRKLIEILIPNEKNIVVRTKPNEDGKIFEFVEVMNYSSWNRFTDKIEYTNNFVPIREISSYSKFFKLIIPKEHQHKYFHNEKLLFNKSICKIDANIILNWFGRLPIAIRSASTKGYPSPIGGLTTEIFSGQEVPKSLIEIIQAVNGSITLTFLPFRPPTGNFDDKQLLKNKPLNKKITQRFLKHFKNENLIDRFLGSYFNELIPLFDEKTITKLKEKYHSNSIEETLINELKNLAKGKINNLVELEFKEKFKPLKNIYVWHKPGENINDKTFNIQKLRILPGHFPFHPSNIDQNFADTLYLNTNNSKIFENKSQYFEKIHLYLQATLLRIINRLTLDQELLIQNYNHWKNAKIANSNSIPLGNILNKSQIFHLAKRFLAPGTTIVYDRKKQRTVIQQITESRVYRYGAFKTPVFIHPKIFKNNMKIYRKIIKKLNINPEIDIKQDPVMNRRKMIQDIIDKIQKNQSIHELIKKTKLGNRTIRIIFQKI